MTSEGEASGEVVQALRCLLCGHRAFLPGDRPAPPRFPARVVTERPPGKAYSPKVCRGCRGTFLPSGANQKQCAACRRSVAYA